MRMDTLASCTRMGWRYTMGRKVETVKVTAAEWVSPVAVTVIVPEPRARMTISRMSTRVSTVSHSGWEVHE